ncbi:unnamed protein product [Lymnaea stagnalis]|uniref:Peptidase M14 domain-containing protein n=1 Tax=Lymnaea stagnalis TaxID=6523 RepID=A0AAV2HFC1_LYMST
MDRMFTSGTRSLLLIVLGLLSLGASLPSAHSNTSYKVVRIRANSDRDVHVIHYLRHKYHLDPWRDVTRAHQVGDYLVRPQHSDDVLRQLVDSDIHHEVVINDVESFLRSNDAIKNRTRRSATAHEHRHKFLTYDELLDFLHHAQNTATNARVQVGSIGKSFEGRDTPYVKFSLQISRGNDSEKGAIFIDSGIHSREWISPAMAAEMIHRLAFNDENDSAVNSLLDMFTWIIVPLVNPDGYAFTFTPGLENRLWRKSRAAGYSSDPYCYGVDLNRNFGYQWNNNPFHGGSANPCSGTFSGPRSFSEPESRNVRDILLRNKNNIKGYLTLHSFGQFFLYPWGYSSDVEIDDEVDLYHVASAFADAMKRKNYQYQVGGSAKVLYPAAGGSDDYVRGMMGVKYAYTVELPPHESSKYGFLLPESDVMSVVSDTWEGIKAFAFRLYSYTKPLAFKKMTSRVSSSGFTAHPDVQRTVRYDNVERHGNDVHVKPLASQADVGGRNGDAGKIFDNTKKKREVGTSIHADKGARSKRKRVALLKTGRPLRRVNLKRSTGRRRSVAYKLQQSRLLHNHTNPVSVLR